MRDQVAPPSEVVMKNDWPGEPSHASFDRNPQRSTPQPARLVAKLTSQGSSAVPATGVVRQCAPASSVTRISFGPLGIVSHVVGDAKTALPNGTSFGMTLTSSHVTAPSRLVHTEPRSFAVIAMVMTPAPSHMRPIDFWTAFGEPGPTG